MKYWIINNTKFTLKNDHYFDYFENIFIPFLEKHSNKQDKIIHLGNIFNASDNINIKLLLKVVDLFIKLSNIIPLTIVDAEIDKYGISKIFKNVDNIGKNKIFNITNITHENDVLYSPSNCNFLEHYNNQKIVFFNNIVDEDILNRYKNTTFIGGYYDDNKINDNIIHVGSPYQFKETNNSPGVFVLDHKSQKHKFIKNTYSPTYQTIKITDISQINDISVDFVNNNYINIVVDKSLVDEKNIKLDVLLAKYNFKSIKYENDNIETDFINSDSISMEKLIKEKIKEDGDVDLLNEFNNIMKIYKNKYNI